jgi:transcriptional regulator with XRE-family HTH domain
MSYSNDLPRLQDLPRRGRRCLHPLALALDAAGVTVTDAAAALGVARSWLSPVLNGKATPGRELAARMDELTAALAAEQGVDDADA